MKDFGRIITAMVTPFDGDLQVDYQEAGRLASHLLSHGSDGLVLAGTTGEAPTLTADEKLELYRQVREAVGPDAPLMLGTGSYSTRATVELSRRAEEAGVDAILVVTPYYNKPPQEDLYRHFRAIAEAVSVPILLYNVPGRTGCNLQAETVARLAQIENIMGIKDASGNLAQVTEILQLCPAPFRVYSGEDDLTLPVLAVGGHGVVSVASHMIGEEMQAMIRAHLDGDAQQAARLYQILHPVFKGLFITSNPIPVKEALRQQGWQVGEYRPPLGMPDDSVVEHVRRVVQAAKEAVR